MQNVHKNPLWGQKLIQQQVERFERLPEREKVQFFPRLIALFSGWFTAAMLLFLLANGSTYGAIVYFFIMVIYFLIARLVVSYPVLNHLLILTVYAQICFLVLAFAPDIGGRRFFMTSVLLPFMVYPTTEIRRSHVIYGLIPIGLYFFLPPHLGPVVTLSEASVRLIYLGNMFFSIVFTVMPFVFIIYLKYIMEDNFLTQLEKEFTDQNIVGLGRMYQGATEKLRQPLQAIGAKIQTFATSIPNEQDIRVLGDLTNNTLSQIGSLRFFSRVHNQSSDTRFKSGEFVNHLTNVYDLQFSAAKPLTVDLQISEQSQLILRQPAQFIQIIMDILSHFPQREDKGLTLRVYRQGQQIVFCFWTAAAVNMLDFERLDLQLPAMKNYLRNIGVSWKFLEERQELLVQFLVKSIEEAGK